MKPTGRQQDFMREDKGQHYFQQIDIMKNILIYKQHLKEIYYNWLVII